MSYGGDHIGDRINTQKMYVNVLSIIRLASITYIINDWFKNNLGLSWPWSYDSSIYN